MLPRAKDARQEAFLAFTVTQREILVLFDMQGFTAVQNQAVFQHPLEWYTHEQMCIQQKETDFVHASTKGARKKL